MQYILFKGFRPDENGEKTIKITPVGHDTPITFKGFWKYGIPCARIGGGLNPNGICAIRSDISRHIYNVIPETVVIYVKQDKKDKFMFVGDIVKSAVSDEIPHGEIRYDEQLCKFYVSINDDYDIIDIDEYEPIVIGNKWEIDNE